MRTAALFLIYSTAEYCAPVWCRSAHTQLIDSVLNDALRIVTGYLRPVFPLSCARVRAHTALETAHTHKFTAHRS